MPTRKFFTVSPSSPVTEVIMQTRSLSDPYYWTWPHRGNPRRLFRDLVAKTYHPFFKYKKRNMWLLVIVGTLITVAILNVLSYTNSVNLLVENVSLCTVISGIRYQTWMRGNGLEWLNRLPLDRLWATAQPCKSAVLCTSLGRLFSCSPASQNAPSGVSLLLWSMSEHLDVLSMEEY